MTTGDFGRRDPGIIERNVLPVTRQLVGDLRGVAVSSYPLTNDEIELRTRSEAIVKAERGFAPGRILGDAIEAVGLGENRYQDRRRVAHNSGRTAYDAGLPSRRRDTLAFLVESDVAEFRDFAGVASRVYRADSVRRAALADGADLPADDIRDTAGRIRENRRVVENTILAMRNRVDDYRLELRRSVVEHPDASGRAAAAIDHMAREVARFEHRLGPHAFPDERTTYPRRPTASYRRNADLLGG